MAQNDAWMETCLISISKEGGSDVEFAGLTETVDIDMGEKDIEGVALVNGGRVTKWTPEGDTTITFETYELEVGNGNGWDDLLHPGTADTTNPYVITNDRIRNKYRIAILWTDDTSATTGVSATADGNAGFRYAFANCYITAVKPSFTDGILKHTVTAKLAPFDKSGDANILMESTDGTASEVLAALASYTSSTKFR